ncbi:hypothetical protein NG798_22845 [Ancylothrix sp. C2]|uniref:hypothetical protein n=1 Tax=Ancylothrix sp. D3o TaxID=2953691 RepID=UPI0021BB423B|nr:hypothetical protein [Ancylothrix sp. D3o]MCT7952640.1 hypothetical protein [Ancylothrix sp. D3o]
MFIHYIFLVLFDNWNLRGAGGEFPHKTGIQQNRHPYLSPVETGIYTNKTPAGLMIKFDNFSSTNPAPTNNPTPEGFYSCRHRF